MVISLNGKDGWKGVYGMNRNQKEWLQEASTLQEELVQHRRWLHAHAEVGFELAQTKTYVKEQLEKLGYKPQECGKAGLVVTVGQGKKNGVFLLRADMDALPITEETGVEYACTTGKMHACGHDMHTTMLLGAAKLLKQHEQEIEGVIKLMFQPAEEIFEGSKDMIESGVLENPKVDAAMMIHVTAGIPMPAGTVIVSSPGVSAPTADYFTIKVQGKGCHGSTPEQGIDSLTAAAHILIALQELQARELGMSEEAVLTIGKMNGGTAGNVIADSTVMEGTIRTYDVAVREKLKLRMTEIAENLAKAFRATAEVTFGSGCPTLVNAKEVSTFAYDCMTELLGKERVFTTNALNQGKPSRSGGSEDFSYISQEVPSVMLAMAAGEPDKGYPYPQHHPKVLFDEQTLSIGSAVYAYAAVNWIKKL